MKLFAFDSPVMQAISTATDYVILNLLWIVCSLPVFTAGAAMSAKYYTSMKLYRGEAPAVFKSFFSSFAKNLKQTILPSIVIFIIMGALTADWFYVINVTQDPAYKWILFIITVVFFMMIFCLFPIIARYEIKTKEAVKTALGLTAAKFPRVFLAIILFILPFIIGIWYFKWAWLICLFSQTVMLYYNSGFFVKEFDKLEARLFGENEENAQKNDTEG
ncbi:MAG: YesL family protein [Lachnospiraceae bacterium]|nr:YesL family protein [Lachnospiraceae bacterium]